MIDGVDKGYIPFLLVVFLVGFLLGGCFEYYSTDPCHEPHCPSKSVW